MGRDSRQTPVVPRGLRTRKNSIDAMKQGLPNQPKGTIISGARAITDSAALLFVGTASSLRRSKELPVGTGGERD